MKVIFVLTFDKLFQVHRVDRFHAYKMIYFAYVKSRRKMNIVR